MSLCGVSVWSTVHMTRNSCVLRPLNDPLKDLEQHGLQMSIKNLAMFNHPHYLLSPFNVAVCSAHLL